MREPTYNESAVLERLRNLRMKLDCIERETKGDRSRFDCIARLSRHLEIDVVELHACGIALDAERGA